VASSVQMWHFRSSPIVAMEVPREGERNFACEKNEKRQRSGLSMGSELRMSQTPGASEAIKTATLIRRRSLSPSKADVPR
jgi:hypothetical protein